MKILFLCTAHNSLSQRLYLELMAAGHDISIEYALSDKVMLEAVELFQPNIIICPVSECLHNSSNFVPSLTLLRCSSSPPVSRLRSTTTTVH